MGLGGGQQDISRANAYLEFRTDGSADEWRFQAYVAVSYAASQSTAIFVNRLNRGVEDVFETCQLRDSFHAGRGHYFMRSALRNDFPLFQYKDTLS